MLALRNRRTSYYAFGSPLPGRQFTSANYRYGFNGKEKDDEIKGAGNSIAFEARIYDSRLGRFLSRDPKAAKYAFFSPYIYAANNPIKLIDVEGEGPGDPVCSSYKGTGNVLIKVFSADEVEGINSDIAQAKANGWDYVIVHNLVDAAKWVEKTYGADKQKINNLVLAAHGGRAGTMLVKSEGENKATAIETRLTNEDFEYYDQGQSDPAEAEQIKAISTIGENLDKKANVLLSVCHLGEDKKLINAIAEKLSGSDKSLTVYSTNDKMNSCRSGEESGIDINIDNNLIKPENYEGVNKTTKGQGGCYETTDMPNGTNVQLGGKGNIKVEQ